MDTDEDLVEPAATDDQVLAVGELYRRHHPAVLRVTQALLRRSADAQDAAQEAFLKAMQSAHGFRRDGPVRRWLLRIATNVAIDEKRSRRRGTADASDKPGASVDPAVAAETAEWERLLLRGLLDLAAEFREPLVLRYWDNCSLTEIARRLGIPRSTANERCRQGLALLRRRLGPRGMRTLPLFLGTLPRVAPLLESASLPHVLTGGATLMASKGLFVVAAIVVVCLPLFFLDWSDSDEPDPSTTPAGSTREEALAPGDGEIGKGGAGDASRTKIETKRFTGTDPVAQAAGGWRVRGSVRLAGVPARPGSVVEVRMHAGWWDGSWKDTTDVLAEATVEVGRNGVFVWVSEPPGTSVTVVAHAAREGFLADTESRLVVGDAAPPQDLKLDLLPLDVWVEGVVRDREGRGVPNPTVRCFSEEITGDEEGRYRIRGTSHFTTQRVSAWIEGSAVTRQTVQTPPAGGTAPLDLVIERGLVVEGRITDAAGQPIANARVSSWEARPHELTTPPSGAYRLVGFARGQRSTFRVHAPGYVRHREWVKEIAKDLKDHDIVLVRGSQVRGMVVDEEGAPIEGARIGIGHGFSMGSTLKTVTDHEGRFRVPDVSAGPVGVHVQRDGFAQLATSVEVPKAGEPVDELRLVLRKGETLLGRVVDEANKPVAGARVAAKRKHDYLEARATTAPDGTFDLVDVAGPDVEIEIYGRGLVRLNTTMTIQPTRADVIVKRHGILAGRVVADATGAPIDRFRLRIVRATVKPGESGPSGYSSELADRGRWFSRSNGEFVIDNEEFSIGVVVGLEVWAEGYAPATNTRVFTTAEPDPDSAVFRLQRAAALSGRVLDAVGGTPIAGARVRWESADAPPTKRLDFDPEDARTFATDADGAFRFDDLPPRLIRIEIDASGYPFFKEGPIAIPGPGTTTERTFYVPRGAVLEGVVEDVPGVPSPGAGVSLRTSDPDRKGGRRYYHAKADADGRFRFEGLAQGRWRVSRQLSVGRYGIGLFGKTVDISEVKTYEVVLRREGEASLVVTIRSQKPLPENLTVNALPLGTTEPRPQSQVALVVNGRATFAAIGAGSWRLIVGEVGDFRGRGATGTVDVDLKVGEKGAAEIELKR